MTQNRLSIFEGFTLTLLATTQKFDKRLRITVEVRLSMKLRRGRRHAGGIVTLWQTGDGGIHIQTKRTLQFHLSLLRVCGSLFPHEKFCNTSRANYGRKAAPAGSRSTNMGKAPPAHWKNHGQVTRSRTSRRDCHVQSSNFLTCHIGIGLVLGVSRQDRVGLEPRSREEQLSIGRA